MEIERFSPGEPAVEAVGVAAVQVRRLAAREHHLKTKELL